MSTREEIREEIAEVCKTTWYSHDYPEVWGVMANEIFLYLHSQGAVIKVERELPDNAIYYPPKQLVAYNAGRRVLAEAGYCAVEPLVEK